MAFFVRADGNNDFVPVETSDLICQERWRASNAPMLEKLVQAVNGNEATVAC